MNASLDVVNQILTRHHNELIYIKDRYSRYIDANQAVVSHYDLRHIEQLRDKTDYDFRMACFAEQYIKHDQEAMETGELQVIEQTLTPDGNEIMMLSHKYFFSDPQTHQSGMIGISREINSTTMLDAIPMLSITTLKHLKISNSLFNINVNKYALTPLSSRELDVLYYILHGLSQKQIADKLNLSVRTVEDYVDHVKAKLRCGNKNQLFDFALQHGLMNIVPKHLLRESH